MMKVLMVNKLYFPWIGGVENSVRDLAIGLKGLEDKVEVEVLAANTRFKTVQEEIDGIKVTKVRSLGRFRSAPLAPSFPLWLRRLKSDIYHFHFPFPPGEISYLFTRPKGKMVVTYHSDIIRQKFLLRFYSPLLKAFLRRAGAIITSSPNMIEYSPFLREFKEKCVVVPFGIDLKRFEANPKILEKSRQIQEKYGQPLLLFIGRLIYYKGLEYLLKAIVKVPAKLLIIGSGPIESKLKTLVRNLKIGEKVFFLGELLNEEIPPYYHASQVFVLPSIARSEAFGIVQLEAQACGKPVVSTNLTTGVPFVNQDNVTGLVVPPCSPQALAEAINKILKNKELCRKYGESGKKRVAKEFTREIMVKRVLKVYQKVMGEA